MTEYYPKVGVCYAHPERSKIYMIYTFTCNAACEHCIVESSPKRKQRLGVETATEILRLGAQYGKSFLDLSGGEAMLYPEEIKQVASTARDLGYYVTLNSNAFWARTPETARRIVGELKDAGIKALFPSASAYHARYVPLERVRNVREACRDVGVEYELNFFYSARPEADQQIITELQLQDEVFFFDGLQTTSNSRSEMEALQQVYTRRKPDDIDDCLSVHLGVNPHGHVVTTCNMNYTNAKFRGTPFFLGNFYDSGFEEILQAERASAVLQFIYSNPHPAMHNLLAGDPEVGAYHHETFAGRTYFSVVDYYLDLFKDPRIMPRLLELLPEPAPEPVAA